MNTNSASINELLQFAFGLTPQQADEATDQLIPRNGQFILQDSAGFDARAKLEAAVEIDRRIAASKLASVSSPEMAVEMLRKIIGPQEHESFWCIWLDSQHNIIGAEEMFRGTATQTSVYPREVVKKALKTNASEIIMAHNHPSGSTQPSRSDEELTRTVRSALSLVDVRVLDHIIITREKTTSMVAMGLL